MQRVQESEVWPATPHDFISNESKRSNDREVLCGVRKGFDGKTILSVGEAVFLEMCVIL